MRQFLPWYRECPTLKSTSPKAITALRKARAKLIALKQKPKTESAAKLANT
jgi:hypothetical protein